jgi:hypothetical protein
MISPSEIDQKQSVNRFSDFYESDNEGEYDNDIDESFLDMDREMTIRDNHRFEEYMACRFGPVWKQTYYILIDLLGIVMPEPIIREILSFHVAEPSPLNVVYQPRILQTGHFNAILNHEILHPQCFNCCFKLNIDALVYVAVSPCSAFCGCNTIKIRLICLKCTLYYNMSMLSRGRISDKIILDGDAKFGPGLIPQNAAAVAASFCIDNKWRICQGQVMGDAIPCLSINMHEIVQAFRSR